MKIIKLTTYNITNVVPENIIKNNKKYKDISLGNLFYFGEKYAGWKYKIHLDYNDFKDLADDKPLVEDNYYLTALNSKNEKTIKDKLGNTKYILKKLKYNEPDNSYIVILELPFLNVTDMKYIINGKAKILAKGITGRFLTENYKETAEILLLEVYGDTEILWRAKDKSNNTYIYYKAEHKNNIWSGLSIERKTEKINLTNLLSKKEK